MEKVEQLQVEYRIRKRLSELPDIISRYRNWLGKTKKPQTVLEYVKDVGLFSDFIKEKVRAKNEGFGQIHFSELTPDDINEFLFQHMPKHEKVYERLNGTEVHQEFQNKGKSKRRKLSALRSFSRFLVMEEKILREDICVGIELEKEEKKTPPYLDVHTQRLLLDTIEKYSEDTFQKIRNQLMTLLFLTTGIKTSELLSLDIQDIDIEKTRFRLLRHEEEEWIYLDKKVVPLLKHYLQLREEMHVPMGWHHNALFLSIRYKRLNRRTIHYIYQRYERFIELDQRLTPQLLRNTFVMETPLKKEGELAVSKQLGVKDMYTMKRTYPVLNNKKKK